MSSWADDVRKDLKKYNLTIDEEARVLAQVAADEALWHVANPANTATRGASVTLLVTLAPTPRPAWWRRVKAVFGL